MSKNGSLWELPRTGRRTIAARIAAPLLCGAIAIAAAGCGGGGGHNVVPPGTSAQEYTGRGWTAFEGGNMIDALANFNSAIQADGSYGPAYVGRGFCLLDQATTDTQMNQAMGSFDDAMSRQQTGADVRCGRAAVQFALGGTHLANAIAEAQAGLQASPDFVFAHRGSLNAVDLKLIEAFSRAGQADFTGALAAADSVQASGIQNGNPGTWTVEGTSYPTFEAAVLAFLQKLSKEMAG